MQQRGSTAIIATFFCSSFILLRSVEGRKENQLTVFSRRRKKCEKNIYFLLIHSYLSIYIYLCINRRLYKPKVHNVKRLSCRRRRRRLNLEVRFFVTRAKTRKFASK